MQLNGLVLIGGQSSRMGTDKSGIQYRDKIHRVYLADLLLKVGCQKVYLSCSADQSQAISLEYSVITDSYQDIGPISGVLSAFEFNADCAWLVIGCDYALLDDELLQELIKKQQEKVAAIAFRHPKSNYLEPLVAIYKPKAYPIIKTAFQNGQYSLRKILGTLNPHCIPLTTPHKLINANTPQEKEQALQYIKNIVS